MIDALTQLRPEIYGAINDEERVELDGLLYIFQRLPRGIEECRYIKLISREGFEDSNFQPIVAPKRRRHAYRIDQEQMYIEMTRGRSDIYDILTHLSFLYIEAEKIRCNSEDHKGRKRREWLMLKSIVEREERGEEYNRDIAYTYLSTLLGRTYDETVAACERFSEASDVNSVFHITYWMGHLATEEAANDNDREITFSSALREKIGHHVYGELWANKIKNVLAERDWLQRPLHIISANLHSVMNSLYATVALDQVDELEDIARELSVEDNDHLRRKVSQYARGHGMLQIDDTSGTSISVQLFDTTAMDTSLLPASLDWDADYIEREKPVILVMDYAFGEQAFETMDELLKPYEHEQGVTPLNVKSISIMGKAGILEGRKGDIMVPNAHVFEGTADNYPFKNGLCPSDFKGYGLKVFEGPMISVLGTSLQNRDILRYFLQSSWGVVGLEMEGAHYQKAIQAASQIRNSIDKDVVLRYAYYASDNPLVSGGTLASGSLGMDGVKPTYLITVQILNRILTGVTDRVQDPAAEKLP